MGILNKKGLLHFILKEMELIILPQNFFFVLFNLFFQIYLSLESLIEFFIFLKHFFKKVCNSKNSKLYIYSINRSFIQITFRIVTLFRKWRFTEWWIEDLFYCYKSNFDFVTHSVLLSFNKHQFLIFLEGLLMCSNQRPCESE